MHLNAISRTVVVAIAGLAAGSFAASAQIHNITVSSASGFERGLPTPGGLAVVFCEGLRDLQPVTAGAGFPLPHELAGVRVTIGGVPAPLYSVTDLGGLQIIYFQVPLDIPEADPIEVVVEQGDQRSAVHVARLATSPGEFVVLGNGPPVVLHSDLNFVSVTHPARPGETLTAFLMGMRATDPQVASGAPAPLDPPAIVPRIQDPGFSDYYRLRVGTVAVDPVFAGLVPGLAGLFRIDFVVPESTPGGPTELQLFRFLCSSSDALCPTGGERMALSSRVVLIQVAD